MQNSIFQKFSKCNKASLFVLLDEKLLSFFLVICKRYRKIMLNHPVFIHFDSLYIKDSNLNPNKLDIFILFYLRCEQRYEKKGKSVVHIRMYLFYVVNFVLEQQWGNFLYHKIKPNCWNNEFLSSTCLLFYHNWMASSSN
jgi:hypothetical protein